MSISIENVFVTEGLPKYTYVKPPNYNNILVDIKKKGKPVIIEGQSGTGKTSTVLKIIEQISSDIQFKYLTARKRDDIATLFKLTREPYKGNFIIDDFHRLTPIIKTILVDYAKIAADEGEDTEYPKLVIIGINNIGSDLLSLSPDITKRCGIHKILPGDWDTIKKLINVGEELLNIKFFRPKVIFNESQGDYWLTQVLCQFACLKNDILHTKKDTEYVSVTIKEVRKQLIQKLESGYKGIVKDFARGKRFRPTNDSYFLLLQALSTEIETPFDLTEIANKNDNGTRLGINKIKDLRLAKHISEKPTLAANFYYNSESKSLNIEDPALFYYIKHLNWSKIKKECGFKQSTTSYKFDIAISFAGENRKLADYISTILSILDFEIFYDELYEANYLGSSWSEKFEEIFNNESRYVVCLLDSNHKEKIWPTFERECFQERIKEQAVIPIFLDDTKFVGIPQDIVGIKFKFRPNVKDWQERASKEILSKLLLKID